MLFCLYYTPLIFTEFWKIFIESSLHLFYHDSKSSVFIKIIMDFFSQSVHHVFNVFLCLKLAPVNFHPCHYNRNSWKLNTEHPTSNISDCISLPSQFSLLLWDDSFYDCIIIEACQSHCQSLHKNPEIFPVTH